MYNPNEDYQRRMPQQMGYETSIGSGSARGALIALLVLVALLGGLVLLGSLNGGVVEADGTTGATTGSEIQSGTTTETMPSTGAVAE